MINLLEPFGNTETFGWPISCHMPYWIEDGRTLLSSSAVFSFLGVKSQHDYKCYSFHLEYHGFKNAFSGGLESDGSFISFEAFLHFLFGGLFPYCHCDKSAPSSKIPEVRRFFMEKLTKGQSIGIASGSESQQLSINRSITADEGEQTGQQYVPEIKIGKCYSIEPQQSRFQGGLLNQKPVDIQDNSNRAVTRNNITVMEDNYFNDVSNERIVNESRHNEGHHVSLTHRDSQLRQISKQPQSSSFITSNVTQPNAKENSSFSDRIPVRLHKQQGSASLGMRSSEPVNYTQKQSVPQTSTLRKDQLSQGVDLSVDKQARFEHSGDDERVQSSKFSNVVVKQENVEGDLEERQGACSFETQTSLPCNESVQIGTEENDDEPDTVDCGPIEVVHLPQEIATGASYFDPSTSSITSGRAEINNFITSSQQDEGIGSQGESLPTDSSHAVEHNNLLNQTPDSISRHIQYSHTVISSEQENSRTRTTDCGQNNIHNKNSYAEADRWKSHILSTPMTSRHKIGKSVSSTCTSTYSQQMQQHSPESGQVSFHNKRRRTDAESSTVTTNIIRHPSVPSATELSSVPSWISLQPSDRAPNVGIEAQRLGSNLGDQNSLNSSISNVTRPPGHYQRTSLLNSNVKQSSSSTTGILPKLKGQGSQDRSDSTAAKKTVRTQCPRCKLWMVSLANHTCHQTNKCPTCGRVFSQRRDVKRHMLTHTGEKPYKCTYKGCKKTFGRKDSLNRHVRIFHKQLML